MGPPMQINGLRQTESDTYEPTMQHAQVGSKINDAQLWL